MIMPQIKDVITLISGAGLHCHKLSLQDGDLQTFLAIMSVCAMLCILTDVCAHYAQPL